MEAVQPRTLYRTSRTTPSETWAERVRMSPQIGFSTVAVMAGGVQ